MRYRFLATAGVAAAAVLVLALPAGARQQLTHQVDVTITNKTCSLQLDSVSRRNTKILFHVIDNGTRPAGLLIYGLKSKFAQSKGSADVMIQFRGPGHYRYSCVAGSYAHPTKVAHGIFTIRKS